MTRTAEICADKEQYLANFEKMNNRELADHYNCSLNVILGLNRKFNLYRLKKIDKAAFEQDFLSLTAKQMGEKYGRDKRSIYYIARGFGLLEKIRSGEIQSNKRIRKPRTEGNMRTTYGRKNRPCLQIKTKNGWCVYSRYVWIQAGLPLEPTERLLFKDGNPLNCALENLKKADGRVSRQKIELSEEARLARKEAKRQQMIELNKKRWEKYAHLPRKERKPRVRSKKERKAKEVASKSLTGALKKVSSDTLWQKQAMDNKKRRQKGEDKVLQTRIIDLSNQRRIQVDKKTWIYIRPDQDEKTVLAKYQKAV